MRSDVVYRFTRGEVVWVYRNGQCPKVCVIHDTISDLTAYIIRYIDSEKTDVCIEDYIYKYILDYDKLLIDIERDIEDLTSIRSTFIQLYGNVQYSEGSGFRTTHLTV